MDENVRNAIKRAKGTKPYIKYKSSGWVYSNVPLNDVKKEHAVITKAEFGSCGYQGINYGLSIDLKVEDGTCCGWTFYSLEDIYELMERTNSKTIKDLKGKPMFALIYDVNCVAGVDVNDELVLDKDEEDE